MLLHTASYRLYDEMKRYGKCYCLQKVFENYMPLIQGMFQEPAAYGNCSFIDRLKTAGGGVNRIRTESDIPSQRDSEYGMLRPAAAIIYLRTEKVKKPHK